VEAVREEEVKLQGVGFVKEVGFKPGVKEHGTRSQHSSGATTHAG